MRASTFTRAPPRSTFSIISYFYQFKKPYYRKPLEQKLLASPLEERRGPKQEENEQCDLYSVSHYFLSILQIKNKFLYSEFNSTVVGSETHNRDREFNFSCRDPRLHRTKNFCPNFERLYRIQRP